MTLKVKVGSLVLTESREVNLPQEHAAWYETVKVEPGTYDVYVYIDWTRDGGGMFTIHSLSAQCDGTTIACYYGGSTRDAERIGKATRARINLATYGKVTDALTLLAQATLHPALVREEWEPEWTLGRMWHFVWDRKVKVQLDEGQQNNGATLTAKIVEV